MFNNSRAMWQVMHDIKLPRDKKEELVKKRLKRVLVSAYKHAPYYRNMMKNIGYNPAIDYKGPEDLRKFPITTKTDLKTDGLNNFLKEGIQVNNLYMTITSGSTGIPLKIFLSQYELTFRVAKWLRVLFMNKYSIKNKVLSLTVAKRLEEGKTVLQKFGLLRRLAVDLLTPPEDVAVVFSHYQPHVLYGNRTPIDLLALELIKRKIKPEDLKLLLVGGEMIHERNKNLFKKAFGIAPTEFYGSNEMGIMAFETQERDGLHLCDDLTYFEFLDKNGNPVKDRDPGRVVVTDLVATTMPFIRYEQGDLATVKGIAAFDGIPEKRITEITGRDDAYFILPDGSILTAYYFSDIIDKQFNEILQYRLIQKTENHFQLKIASNKKNFDKIKRPLRDLLIRKFPEGCYFEILRVDLFKSDPQGKLQMLISEVNK